MASARSSGCSGMLDGIGIFDISLPGSPFAGDTAQFAWEALEDVVALDECAAPGTRSTACLTDVEAQHAARAHTNAQSAEDLFDALDAFLETEFPMGDSFGQPPTKSSCWMSPVSTPTSAQPANSTSSCGTAAMGFSMSDVTAPLLCSPFEGLSSIPVPLSHRAQSAGAIAAAVSAVKAASNSKPVETTTPMPRWKVYHMQQRQELLAPKQPGTAPTSSADSAVVTAQGPATSATAASAHAASASAVTGVTATVARANSVTSSFSGGLALPSVSPAALTAEHVLLLNALQQQQQLQLLQQQQVLSAKRTLAAADFGMPTAKRCRTAAAGSVAAQHLYGLTAPEPVNQLQHLQAVQLQLQAQMLQNHQQQIEQYQQQQIQALHRQLHLRLQVQQHQQAVQLMRTTTCK